MTLRSFVNQAAAGVPRAGDRGRHVFGSHAHLRAVSRPNRVPSVARFTAPSLPYRVDAPRRWARSASSPLASTNALARAPMRTAVVDPSSHQGTPAVIARRRRHLRVQQHVHAGVLSHRESSADLHRLGIEHDEHPAMTKRSGNGIQFTAGDRALRLQCRRPPAGAARRACRDRNRSPHCAWSTHRRDSLPSRSAGFSPRRAQPRPAAATPALPPPATMTS